MMKRDLPILFSAPMVRALLAGTKTQTRRVMLPQPYALDGRPGYWNASGTVGGRICINDRALLDLHRKPKPGDRLYVRENWRVSRTMDLKPPRDLTPRMMTVLYEAGGSSGGIAPYPKDGSPRPLNEYEQFEQPEAGQMPDWAGRLRAGMHMPRWASRITLIVTDVRVQRLQEISESDAIAEGCIPDYASLNPNHIGPARSIFEGLWDSLNAERGYGWAGNPWVTVTTFAVELRNIDQIGAE